MKRMVQLKWFNHLPIHNEKFVPDEIKKENCPYCLNNPLINVEDKELQKFESNTFASSFTQEMSTYAENCNNKDTIFEEHLTIGDINENVSFTNEIKPYSLLIENFKEMTYHLEGHSTVDDINKIRAYLNNNIVKAKKRSSR